MTIFSLASLLGATAKTCSNPFKQAVMQSMKANVVAENTVSHNELSPGREASCVSVRPAIDVVKVLFVETGQETARTDNIQKVITLPISNY